MHGFTTKHEKKRILGEKKMSSEKTKRIQETFFLSCAKPSGNKNSGFYKKDKSISVEK